MTKTIHISPDVLDYLSCYDILLLHVSGRSVNDIAEELDILPETVDKAVIEYLGTLGNRASVNGNPYSAFKRFVTDNIVIPSEEEFVSITCPFMPEETATKYYDAILLFNSVRHKYLHKYRKEDYGNFIRKHFKAVARNRRVSSNSRPNLSNGFRKIVIRERNKNQRSGSG